MAEEGAREELTELEREACSDLTMAGGAKGEIGVTANVAPGETAAEKMAVEMEVEQTAAAATAVESAGVEVMAVTKGTEGWTE